MCDDVINTENLLLKSIDTLNLPYRIQRVLKRNHIFYISQLIERTEKDILSFKDLGKRSTDQLMALLAMYKLTLKKE